MLFRSRNNKKDTKNDLQLDKYDNVKKTIKNYQKFIKENFKFVGENFAYEARSIHYNPKKNLKVYMEMLQRKILWNLKKRALILR